MAIRLDEIEEEGRGAGAWRIPPRRAFARSAVYSFLRRAMSRYVLSQTLGRSFLMAGHRGAGKTALVEQVIYDLRWDAIEQVAKGEHGTANPVRPLLVKLHGPSLLAPQPTSTTHADGAAAPPSLPAAVAPLSSESDPAAPRIDEATAEQALVQITLALYRALAEEAAWGFALHARAVQDQRRGDDVELSGQLNLELDLAPEPSTLRLYWRRLSRLDSGVLWPAPPAGAPQLPPDQGVREVVALSTTAQAFRVCAGKSSHTETLTATDEMAQSLAAKGTGDLSAMVNKIGAVVVGGAVGGALSAGATPLPWAVIGALAAGLLTNLTFTWSDTRNRNRKRDATYTFIRDTTTPTLDRELPLAIQRIKAAGLTPVFVVDELDKIENSAERVAALIARLKHLVTDFGFFCFLTDRDCFEAMEAAVLSRAYPVEHTYFSDRLFITYAPEDLLQYLLTILEVTGGPTGPAEEAAVAIFALETLLRAKPHFIDVNRRLVRACDEQGILRAPASDLTALRRQLAAVFQLAILAVLDEPEVRSRLAEDPIFLQLLVDTLYWPVEAWEREERAFSFDEAALAAYLATRSGRKGPTAAELLPHTLQFLHEQLRRLLDLLCDFSRLPRALTGVAGRLNLPIASIVPRSPAALAVRESVSRYQFQYDVRGAPIPSGAVPAVGPAAHAPPAKRLEEAIEFVDAVRRLFTVIKTSIDVAVSLRLLPGTLSARGIGRLRAQLLELLRAVHEREPGSGPQEIVDEIGERLAQVEALRAAIDDSGDLLSRFILLAVRVNALIHGRTANVRDVLETLVRLHGVRRPDDTLLPAEPPPFKGLELKGETIALQAWTSALHQWRDQCVDEAEHFDPGVSDDAWTLWFSRVEAYFAHEPDSVPLQLHELASGALGVGPSAVFRFHLDEMTLADWSELVCRPTQADPKLFWPQWAIVAGLRALGAPRRLQAAAAHDLPRSFRQQGTLRPEPGHPADLVQRDGSDERAGTLMILRDDSPVERWAPEPGRFVMTVRASDYLRYSAFIDWLTSLQAFETVAIEDDDEG